MVGTSPAARHFYSLVTSSHHPRLSWSSEGPAAGGRSSRSLRRPPGAGPPGKRIRGISAQQPDAATCPCPVPPTHISAAPSREIPADHQSERARTCSFFFSAPVVTSNRRIDYPSHRNHGLDKHGSKRNWNSVSVDRSELQQQRSKPVAGYSRGLHPTSRSG